MHPHLEGTPILLGDWLHATDPDCNGPTGQTFTYMGEVIAITDFSDGIVAITMKNATDLSEEFFLPGSIIRRVEAPS